MKSRPVTAFLLSMTIAFVASTAVLANHIHEAQNGADTNPTGLDNPDGVTGNYAYWNVSHDASLWERQEPDHDTFRDREMRWSLEREDFLEEHRNERMLVIEQRIHDQYFYNGGPFFSTNLPWSSAPHFECCGEEWIQRYSEADMEIRDPALIIAQFTYFYHLQWDSEKRSEANKPEFWSEVEWELQTGGSRRWDATGKFFKAHLQQ